VQENVYESGWHYWYGVYVMGLMIWVLIPARGKVFLFSKSVQTGPGAHPVSCSLGSREFCPQGLEYIVCEVYHLNSLSVGTGVA
jgi:hypothetical protein